MYIEQQLRRLGCHQLVFLEHDRIHNEATRHWQAIKLLSFLELHSIYTQCFWVMQHCVSFTTVIATQH